MTTASNLSNLRVEKVEPNRLADLRDLLHKLYGARADFPTWFANLAEQIKQLINLRPAPMLALDSIRQANPNWFMSQQMIAYTTYVDRFGGTLKGVAEKIPHLQSLGVTYLHLLPFLKARRGDNDGGFAVASFEEVEPNLGSMDDLSDLARELREVGITLCSDIVLNHVADDHDWALKARAGDPIYSDYFVFVDDLERKQYEPHLRQVFPETAPGNFTYVESKQAYVWTTFYSYQWDLNYANPAVFAEMALALLKLTNRGIDALRLDSVAYLWKQKGTSCVNLDAAHWIVQAMRCIIDIAAPATLLKAEAILPTQDLPPYLGVYQGGAYQSPRNQSGVTDAGLSEKGPSRSTNSFGVAECQTAYHSSLMSAMWLAVAEQNTEVLQQVIRNTPDLPASRTWLSYVRCHDDIGWNVLGPELTALGDPAMQRTAHASSFFSGEITGSFAKGSKFQVTGTAPNNSTNGMTSALCGLVEQQTEDEKLFACRRILLLYRLSYAFGAIPLIYMGDELGLGNCLVPSEGMSAAEDGRSIHRPVMSELWFAQRSQPGTTVFDIYQRFVRLAKLRASLPQLAANQSRRVVQCSEVSSEPGQPAIGRPCLVLQRGDDFVMIANFTDRPSTVLLSLLVSNEPLIGARFKDIDTGEIIYIQGFILEPWQSRWLVIDSQS